MSIIDMQEFLAFAKRQPPDEEYMFESVHNCALAQFARHKFPSHDVRASARGFEVLSETGHWRPFVVPPRLLEGKWWSPEDNFLIGDVERRGTPQSWGKLVERLEARLAAAEVLA